MFPSNVIHDLRNITITDTELLTQCNLGILSGAVQLSNSHYFFSGELGKAASRAGPVKILNGMPEVLTAGNIFQVFKSVVRLAAIPMVNFLTRWAGAYKSGYNESVYVARGALPVSPKMRLQISLTIVSRLLNAACLSWLIASNLPQIADFVNAFIVNYIAPLLFHDAP